jgi:hypothetical protein
MLGSRKMGESYAPSSASPGVVAPAPPRIELGMLRNGLGSIRNLELLIKSIKVGQKGLFAAVSAVHADCAAMIADAVALSGALSEMGVDAGCAERLSSALATSLRDLEGMLACVVESGRLSVAQRLKLERDLSRCGRELGSTLPLVSLFERTCRPRPLELTPVALVHASSAERSEQKSVLVHKLPSASAASISLSVDLEAAKTLVAIGVALVLEGNPDGRPRLAFELQSGGAPVSVISLGPEKPRAPGPSGARSSATSGHVPPGGVASGNVAAPTDPACLHITPVRLSAPSVLCAEVAARRLGGRFEYAREARRVCIYWPLS